MLSPPRRDAGFTLMEIVVALAVIAVLAGVLMTQVTGRLRQGETAGLAQDLASLNRALTAFRGDVGRYPAELVQLSAPPTGTSRDACGQVLGAAAQEWAGPYVDRTLTPAGLGSGSATIRNALVRSPGTGSSTSFATLFLQVEGVDRAVADELEAAYDGTPNLATGAIRWTAGSTADRGTLSFAVPIRGC